MTEGTLVKGPSVLRLAVTVCAAFGVAITALPIAAQDSRSLQDMLLTAVRLGDSATVRTLLAAGADVAKRGANGKSAIDVAVETNRFEIAELLVQERRRQRDAAITQPALTLPAEAEIDQRSAEAAPEIIPERVVSLPRAPLPAPPVSYVPMPAPQGTALPVNVPSGATVEQLLAVAQQLTLAAQNLAAAQRAATARDLQPQPVRVSQPLDPDFLPKPGRKPETEQAALAAPARSRPLEMSATASNTVVVVPRPRTVDEGVEEARRSLESGEDLPAILPAAVSPSANSPASAPPASAPIRVTPSAKTPIAAPAADGEDAGNGLTRAVRGIGSFLGIGDAKKLDASETAPTAQPTPSHAKPGSARETMKRDRSNVPHVPARRASDLDSQVAPQRQTQIQTQTLQPSAQTQLAQIQPSQAKAALQPPTQAGMPPVRAVPVSPVQEQPLSVVARNQRPDQGQVEIPPPNMAAPSMQTARLTARRSGGLNPFDPDNMPQGSVLPLTDPRGGNAPEIARARMLPEPSDEKVAIAQEEASLRETLRQSASPQRAQPAPAARVPDVPPLRDPAGSTGPTSMFERRAPQPAPVAGAKPAAKQDEGILRSMANAVGINSNDDEMPNDVAGVSDSERITTKRMPVRNLRQPLADSPLTLGNSVATEQKPLPRGVAEPDPCIKRSGGALQFCVVPVDWHPRVDPAFSLTTYLYQGSRAIARYDRGKATHYHTLFSSLAYDDVVKFFTAKYGPPTDEWKRSIAPFDQPRQPNPTLVWRSKDSRTNKVTILEVRRYDDTRNVFPDMEHGAVRLYAAGAQRVFPVVTGMDLMGIDWAARSNHTDNPNDPALANTIRVGK